MNAARSARVGQSAEARRWIAIAKEVEGILTGGGEDLFQLRFGEMLEKLGLGMLAKGARTGEGTSSGDVSLGVVAA